MLQLVREGQFIHSHDSGASSLDCLGRDEEVEGTQPCPQTTLQQRNGWASSPWITPSGLAHLGSCYQGQLYSAAQRRHRAYSSSTSSSALMTLWAAFPTAAGGEGERRGEGITSHPHHLTVDKWWDQLFQAFVLRVAHPCPCQQGQLCCSVHALLCRSHMLS